MVQITAGLTYLRKICAIIFSRHANAYCIILINDKYDLPFGIKDDVHDRRAAKHPHVQNVCPKPEDMFPGPENSVNTWSIQETRSDCKNL